ncbi:MAG TPA: type II secretion system protein [Ramlibacter sp.]|uniref:type II secretion system protein n=1 Tax=Ramlibacter sp. TaxID=1917967 RepID=UPI002D7F4063|nr:type II secretion system protein [Ramlibacter sp.]HET8747624.1 type II secretion system protein [Ramlibacter sp.]
MRAGKARAQGGFTYLTVLFLVVLLGIGLAGTGETWSLTSRRAREKELLWVGNQYARAIRSYYMQSPGARQFPAQLEDLLEDRRFPIPRHHLRQLYADPITREGFQTVLAEDGRIGGVRSRSDDTPLKQDNFPAKFRDFKGATQYSDWLFIADNLPGSPRNPNAAAVDPATGMPPGTPASGPGATANPGAPATATPTSADTGTPGTATPTPAARPGPVISIKR